MAIERKTVIIPAKTESQISKVTCDLCGAEKPGHPSNTDNWEAGCFDVLETEVSIKDGNRYPEGGDVSVTEWHICPKCFRDKLIPWLETQGAAPTTNEISY